MAEINLRAYFAAHAPEAFHCDKFLIGWEFSEPQPIAPVGFDYHAKGGSAGRDESASAEKEYVEKLEAWKKRRDVARMVAARWAYADAMLKGSK